MMTANCKKSYCKGRLKLARTKTEIFRTRVYAVLKGMELADGDFMEAEHVIDGRLKDARAYSIRAKRLFPNFIPRSINIFSQKVSMNEETFYKYATFEEPQEWNPEEHTKNRHADVKNNEDV